MTEVFPKSVDELAGLIATDPRLDHGCCFVRPCDTEFEWKGQTIRNYRKQLWIGYKDNDPDKTPILLCTDQFMFPNPTPNVKFFKP